MALTEVPIELSSTPGIVDNSTGTAITIDASQNVTLSANLTVNGDLITFGDANTDSIDFNAEISSNLIPSGARDLGSVGKEWTNLYISGTGDVATLTSASSTIGTLTVSTTATIPYNNVTSGLTAVNVQSALDELAVLTGGGNVGSQANFDVYEFTATNLQTTFDLNATYSKTYVPGYIQVYLNGLLLSETDYVASNGNTVVLNSGADASDILAIVVLDSFNTATQLRVLSIDASASDDAVSVDATNNVTLLGELRGPATFVIDPAAIGDNTGTVQIKGNLQVDGTQTTINSTTLDVTDLNITVASGAADAASANGAGITVDGAAANITYTSATDSWDFNKEIIGSSNIVTSGFNRFIANSTSAGDYVRIYGADGTGKWDIYGNGANLRIGDNESLGLVQIDTGMYVVGDVGIGTGIPARLLELSTTTASESYLRISGNSGNVENANFAGIEFYNLDSSGVGPNVASFIEARSQTSTGAGGELVFATSSSSDSEGARATERMRIDATGQVGIGGTPSTLLHVIETDNGAPDAIVRIESDDTAGSRSLLQYVGRNNSNVATYATIHTDAVAAGENAPIVFSQGASEANERMRIDESGNVGINDNDPDAYLHVSGLAANSAVAGVIFEGSWPWLKFKDTESGQDTYTFYNDNALYLTRLSFANSGNAPNGGTNLFNVGTAETVFNNDSVDQDFRVESVNDTHMMFVDAENDRVGIKNGGPISPLHINAGVSAAMHIDTVYGGGTGGITSFSNAGTVNPILTLRTGYGDAPSTTPNEGMLWGLKLTGYNGSADDLSVKSAAVYARSEDSGGGYNRTVGLEFQTSAFDAAASLATRITGDKVLIHHGAATFNEDGADADFRVESNSITHALFVDAGNNTVNINYSNGNKPASAAGTQLQIGQNNNASQIFHDGTTADKGFISGTVNDDYAFYEGPSSGVWNERLRFTNGGEAVFNDGSLDRDFRVESSTNTHALFVDAGNDTVSIGTSSAPTDIGVSAPSLRVSDGIHVASHYSTSFGNPNGRVFTLSTGLNGAATWLKLEGSDHLGYRSTWFRCHNTSGNWNVTACNVVTQGTAPTFTLANNGTANPTITLGFNTDYSGGFVRVEMHTTYFRIS